MRSFPLSVPGISARGQGDEPLTGGYFSAIQQGGNFSGPNLEEQQTWSVLGLVREDGDEMRDFSDDGGWQDARWEGC